MNLQDPTRGHGQPSSPSRIPSRQSLKSLPEGYKKNMAALPNLHLHRRAGSTSLRPWRCISQISPKPANLSSMGGRLGYPYTGSGSLRLALEGATVIVETKEKLQAAVMQLALESKATGPKTAMQPTITAPSKEDSTASPGYYGGKSPGSIHQDRTKSSLQYIH